MLDFNLPEMAVVLVVALVVIGPKDLPKAMRVVGYWIGKARGVARQFRSGLDEMIREAELHEMEKKWQEENERIMRAYPTATAATATADPAALPPPAADEAPPVMVEQPVVLPADPVAPPAPEAPADAPKAAS